MTDRLKMFAAKALSLLFLRNTALHFTLISSNIPTEGTNVTNYLYEVSSDELKHRIILQIVGILKHVKSFSDR